MEASDAGTPKVQTWSKRLKSWVVPATIMGMVLALVLLMAGTWKTWASEHVKQTTDDAYVRAVRIALAGYDRAGRHFVVLAVGCTGGKHRSVAMGEEIAARLSASWSGIQVSHRDLGRE